VSDAPKRQFGNYQRLLPKLAEDPHHVELFAGEADVSRLLDHPNIVKVFEVGVIREVYFMVMELIDGRDLGAILRKCKQRNLPMPVDFALYIQRTLLEALAYAHGATAPSGRALDIAHGDVSPSNIFISKMGEVKLGDFGSARVRGQAAESGVIAGKPYYLSPEALTGEITREADLWSAAVTLYELLTLERPFSGATPEEVFQAIRGGGYVPVHELRPDVPRAIEALVDRGLASAPEERFATAQDFASEMDGLFDPNVGTPLGIAAVVRGLFGAE
jgi:serine/threonine protein kinase